MSDMQRKVMDFNAAVSAIRGDTPAIRDAELRAQLILEEAFETVAALVGPNGAYYLGELELDKIADQDAGDLVQTVDGLMDLLYVTFGALDALGISPELAAACFDAVHSHNLMKTGCPKDEHGKVVKPPGFVSPNAKIRDLLIAAGWSGK